MAEYSVQRITRSGIVPSLAAVAASDTFANDGRTFLWVDNGSGGATSVTFDIATDPHASDPSYSSTATAQSVAAGTVELLGPFPTNRFGSTVTVNFDPITTITAGAFAI